MLYFRSTLTARRTICVVFQINPNSKAYNEGIQVGDYVESINGQPARGAEHQEAQRLIKAATDELILQLTRYVTDPLTHD